MNNLDTSYQNFWLDWNQKTNNLIIDWKLWMRLAELEWRVENRIKTAEVSEQINYFVATNQDEILAFFTKNLLKGSTPVLTA